MPGFCSLLNQYPRLKVHCYNDPSQDDKNGRGAIVNMGVASIHWGGKMKLLTKCNVKSRSFKQCSEILVSFNLIWESRNGIVRILAVTSHLHWVLDPKVGITILRRTTIALPHLWMGFFFQIPMKNRMIITPDIRPPKKHIPYKVVGTHNSACRGPITPVTHRFP